MDYINNYQGGGPGPREKEITKILSKKYVNKMNTYHRECEDRVAEANYSHQLTHSYFR